MLPAEIPFESWGDFDVFLSCLTATPLQSDGAAPQCSAAFCRMEGSLFVATSRGMRLRLAKTPLLDGFDHSFNVPPIPFEFRDSTKYAVAITSMAFLLLRTQRNPIVVVGFDNGSFLLATCEGEVLFVHCGLNSLCKKGEDMHSPSPVVEIITNDPLSSFVLSVRQLALSICVPESSLCEALYANLNLPNFQCFKLPEITTTEQSTSSATPGITVEVITASTVGASGGVNASTVNVLLTLLKTDTGAKKNPSTEGTVVASGPENMRAGNIRIISSEGSYCYSSLLSCTCISTATFDASCCLDLCSVDPSENGRSTPKRPVAALHMLGDCPLFVGPRPFLTRISPISQEIGRLHPPDAALSYLNELLPHHLEGALKAAGANPNVLKVSIQNFTLYIVPPPQPSTGLHIACVAMFTGHSIIERNDFSAGYLQYDYALSRGETDLSTLISVLQWCPPSIKSIPIQSDMHTLLKASLLQTVEGEIAKRRAESNTSTASPLAVAKTRQDALRAGFLSRFVPPETVNHITEIYKNAFPVPHLLWCDDRQMSHLIGVTSGFDVVCARTDTLDITASRHFGATARSYLAKYDRNHCSLTVALSDQAVGTLLVCLWSSKLLDGDGEKLEYPPAIILTFTLPFLVCTSTVSVNDGGFFVRNGMSSYMFLQPACVTADGEMTKHYVKALPVDSAIVQ